MVEYIHDEPWAIVPPEVQDVGLVPTIATLAGKVAVIVRVVTEPPGQLMVVICPVNGAVGRFTFQVVIAPVANTTRSVAAIGVVTVVPAATRRKLAPPRRT